ncbi:thiamine-phosphate synthase family protein [Halobellus rufus]|uniref:thiamine-phosphate synthase family protein n=1 Tax=Halobellus rufus TaxID=1448860 RepID=UPI0006794169|nr:thiamine-phosphate synthase family protein [Halobellus rufus]
MKFIEEVVVEEFLPTFRSMLAEALRERGLTQHEVAEALGISQSAVSKYAHGDVARRDEVLEDERVAELVEHVADGLATGDMTRVQALVEAEVLVRRLEEGDLLARLHEEAMPELADYDGYARIHDPESGLRTSEQVRSSLRQALRRLTNASGFAGLIPNVGSNLVECLPEAGSVDDVAGVPGRIVDVKGRATVPGDPEFGVSEHVANVLLSARKGGADVRAALNVRYDKQIVADLEAAGYDAIEFDPDAPTDPIREAVASRDPDDRSATFVCYQTGGFGIEPITYVLGPDADSVVTAVKTLLGR